MQTPSEFSNAFSTGLPVNTVERAKVAARADKLSSLLSDRAWDNSIDAYQSKLL